MKKAGFLLILIFLASSFLLSQDYKGKARVFGYVFDEEGNPIDGVSVKLFSLRAQGGFTVKTDKDGKWIASWIRGGGWNVDFEKIGYMPKKISINIVTYGKNPEVTVNLKKVEGLVITEDMEKDLVRGNELFDQGKYEEAIQAYEKILEEFPEAYIINRNIGNCFFQQENYEKAEEYYKKILENDPKSTSAVLAVGNCYNNRGENEKSLEWYRKIEFEKLDDPTVLYNIGTSFTNSSEHQEALKYYRRAVETQDDFLDGIYQLGLTYLTLGSFPEALETFEKYVTKDPNSERATQVKGFIEYLKRESERNNRV